MYGMKYDPKIPSVSSPEHSELAESFLTRFKGKKITVQNLTDLLYSAYQKGIEDACFKMRADMEAEAATPLLDQLLAQLRETEPEAKRDVFFTTEELESYFKDE